ncbi:MAG: hypothetical protein ACLTZE_08480 [Evtepia sp.]
MALHEKLTSLAKDAATKANSLAKDAASKANTAIENGKLSLKINNEEKKIDEFTLNIGELILDQLDGGETFDDEIMALYSSIQAARDVITAARADIEANRQSAGPADEDVDDGPAVCESCGLPLTENANYCANCGAKVEPFVEVEEDGAEEADVCECAPTEEAPAEETTVEGRGRRRRGSGRLRMCAHRGSPGRRDHSRRGCGRRRRLLLRRGP